MLSVRRFDPRVLWGALLIVGGVLFLLQNLGMLPGGQIFWGIVFGAAGLAFLWVFLSNRIQWWALLPGTLFIGLGLFMLLEVFAPSLADRLDGLIILGSLSLGFWLIYAFSRQNWWAVIPGGVMLTLAGVAFVESNFPEVPGLESGGLFFLGLGATFLLLGLLPTPQGQMRWAFIPGGILAVMGVLAILAFGSLINYIWPVLLIVGGLALVWRAFRPRSI